MLLVNPVPFLIVDHNAVAWWHWSQWRDIGGGDRMHESKGRGQGSCNSYICNQVSFTVCKWFGQQWHSLFIPWGASPWAECGEWHSLNISCSQMEVFWF